MILQLQAKVHGLGYLGVSTCSYSIFSEFEAPKRYPFLPPFITMTVWLTVWLTDWLTDWLIDWLIAWSIDWMTHRLTDYWLTDWLTGWLIWLIAWLARLFSTTKESHWNSALEWNFRIAENSFVNLKLSMMILKFCRRKNFTRDFPGKNLGWAWFF